jgi:thiol:disulfide interchange protein
MKQRIFLAAAIVGLLAAALSTPADNTPAGPAKATNAVSATQSTNGPKAPAVASHPKIYDENADGAKQIEEALVTAKKEGKRVLLKFGANWCIWCHRLHHTFEKDAAVAAELKKDYVVVLIDRNKDHNKATDEKYGFPTKHGLPVLVVLDADGKQLTTKDTGQLEEKDHHSPDKVLAFLKEWAPKP